MTPNTLFVGLRGNLVLRQHWQNNGLASADAYSLLVTRSTAMGWLCNQHQQTGLWGMNNAHIRGTSTDAFEPYDAWFQVGLARSIADEPNLPIQPFFSCVDSVVNRMSQFHLETLRLLMPMQIFAQVDQSSALGALLSSGHWFEEHPPDTQKQVTFTLHSGQNFLVDKIASDMFKWLQRFKQHVIAWDYFSLDPDSAMQQSPTSSISRLLSLDSRSNGPEKHCVEFGGTVTEWSLDALGWVSSYLALAGVRYGIDTPVVLTIKSQ